MKIKIGPYPRWFGPYQLAETLCFWATGTKEYGFRNKPDWVHHFGEWLAHGSIAPESEVGEIYSLTRERPVTWLYKLLSWVHKRQKRTVKIRIDRYDVWNAHTTMSMIILPMLKELKVTKQGAPFVDDEDVPEELTSARAEEPKKNDWDTDSNHFKRWDWVLDEMIFAFEADLDEDAESQFSSGTIDIAFKKREDGCSEMVRGPNDTHVIDVDARKAYYARVAHGFKLFGKYYQSLWN